MSSVASTTTTNTTTPSGFLPWAPAANNGPVDPLVGKGKHFGRIGHPFVDPYNIITQGSMVMIALSGGKREEELSPSEVAILRLWTLLKEIAPTLEARIAEFQVGPGETREVALERHTRRLADFIKKGQQTARSDDTKSLKRAVIDWLDQLAPLDPPIARDTKDGRGFGHPRTGALLCPTDLDWNNHEVQQQLATRALVPNGSSWSRFLYKDLIFEKTNPWAGFMMNQLILNAVKFIFTSPSSVGSSTVKTTRACNARIYGMTRMTVGALAYCATQVRFALSSAAIFSRADRATDTEAFYGTLYSVLTNNFWHVQVNKLLHWYNLRIFPEIIAERPIAENSALAVFHALQSQLELDRERAEENYPVPPAH